VPPEILEQYRVLVAFGAVFCSVLLCIEKEWKRAIAAILVGGIAYVDSKLWQSIGGAEKSNCLLVAMDMAGVLAALFVLGFIFDPAPKVQRMDGAVLSSIAYVGCCGAYWLALLVGDPDLLALATRGAPDGRALAVKYIVGFAAAAVALGAFFRWNRKRRSSGGADHWGAYCLLLVVYLIAYLCLVSWPSGLPPKSP
jgi:hypothetical protein